MQPLEAILEADDHQIKLGSTSVLIWTYLSESLAKELQLFLDLNDFLNILGLGAPLFAVNKIAWLLSIMINFIKANAGSSIQHLINDTPHLTLSLRD